MEEQIVATDGKVLAAMIAAITSIFLAIFGIFTSYIALKNSNKASESAKRSEQVRLKATIVGEDVMSKLTNIIKASDRASGIINKYKGKVPEDIFKNKLLPDLKPLGEDVIELKYLMYSTAIYTTEEIRLAFLKTVGKLMPEEGAGVNLADWPSFVSGIKENHRQIAALFYNEYLKGTL